MGGVLLKVLVNGLTLGEINEEAVSEVWGN